MVGNDFLYEEAKRGEKGKKNLFGIQIKFIFVKTKINGKKWEVNFSLKKDFVMKSLIALLLRLMAMTQSHWRELPEPKTSFSYLS